MIKIHDLTICLIILQRYNVWYFLDEIIRKLLWTTYKEIYIIIVIPIRIMLYEETIFQPRYIPSVNVNMNLIVCT